MLLRMQDEESFRSFVARNCFLQLSDPVLGDLKRLRYSYISSYDIRYYASIFGFEGCIGFNRLLHSHTSYPRQSFIKSDRDVSYSGYEYISSSLCFESEKISCSFCPDCVREDLKSLGFSYWRRIYREDVLVCARHNVLLIGACPYCSRPFSRKGHDLDVMWRGCSGLHLGDAPSVNNPDSFEYKKAKFFHDAFQLGISVSAEAVLANISAKLKTSAVCVNLGLEKRERAIFEIIRISEVLDSANGHLVPLSVNNYQDSIWDLVVDIYDDVFDLLEEVKKYGGKVRPVSPLMATYRVSDYSSAIYVEEDYGCGVAKWWSPFPSPIDAANGVHKVSKDVRKYLCCNIHLPRQKSKWSPKMMVVPRALPKVPLIYGWNA